jgi:hypothetical protein
MDTTKMKNFSLVLMLFLLSSYVYAGKDFECYIVTGFKHDIDTLDEYKTSIKVNYGQKKVKCRKFKSWDELYNRYKKLHTSPKKILILQAAHGTPGGGAILDKVNNSKEPSSFPALESEFETLGGDIFFHLKEISRRSKIAFINQSCFSGDLILKKIYHESINQNSPTVDNMCIISASGFNLGNFPEGYVEYLREVNFKGSSPLLTFYNKTERSMISGSPLSKVINLSGMIKEASSTRGSLSYNLEKLNFKPKGASYSCYKMSAILVNLTGLKLKKRKEEPSQSEIAKVEYLISQNQNKCTLLTESAYNLLEYIKGNQPVDTKSLALLLASRIGTSIKYDNLNPLNAYFGALSRRLINESNLSSLSHLEKRQYDACKNF